MNQMNMAGMNPAAGGAVGGIPMMNTGSSAPRTDPNSHNNADSGGPVVLLNTYIYDYFLKKGYHDCARALVQDESVPINTTKSPRRDTEVNGVDSEMGDSKDEVKKIPDDLPRPALIGDSQHSSFLFEWWNLFWDIWAAQRRKGKSPDAVQYLQHAQNMMRMRESQQQQQQHHMRQMMPNSQFGMRGMRAGMMPTTNLQKAALQNNTQNMTPHQMAHLQKNQQAQMLQHQMQREQSDIEMNGHRPQSPSSVDNAPSPSKRPRLDASQMNGQQMTPNGRQQGQIMPGQQNPATSNLLMQHGINPRNLTPHQFHTLQAQNPSVQQKTLEVYNQTLAMHHQRSNMNNQGMPNGLMNAGVMPNPDMMQMADGQGMLPMQDYYGGNAQMGQQMRAGGIQTPNAAVGNHALQDYQMQLMLLEQQNKRRLLMARQEQDTRPNPDQPGMPNQGNLPPGTSPQGSRTGASPNPSDQMKRGTPKLPQNGLPGSPNVGDTMQGRGSPASMNFGGQMPPDMTGSFFGLQKGMQEGVMGPNGMRPPSSNPAFNGPQVPQPMDAAMRAQQQGGSGVPNRIPGTNWQQGPQGQQPMVPQQQPNGPGQPVGTPQERNTMPPPQAPPASANNATGRTQTSSPQPGSAAPPTPQQTNKPAPKKKEAKENARKRPPKKGAAGNATTAATPSSEAEPPPTPTPTTPITPVHPNSFNKNPTSNPQQPTSAPSQSMVPPPQQPPQQPQQPPVQDPQPFGDISLADGINLDFSSLEGPDILETFDFNTFLNTDDDTGYQFDPNMGYTDGLETGAADGTM